jgi:hypothetical protein
VSAVRYSGSLRITVEYIDAQYDYNNPNGQYRCVVSGKFGRDVVWVGAPKCLMQSVDSPKAFDLAAHAAISFACDKDGNNDVAEEAETTESGWLILREAAYKKRLEALYPDGMMTP